MALVIGREFFSTNYDDVDDMSHYFSRLLSLTRNLRNEMQCT